MRAGNVLEIDRVSKRYGEVVALEQMAFDVRAGELFGFVGSNGAGKTTTMRIALGVLEADSGQVRWRGAGRAALRPGRHRLGVVHQCRGEELRSRGHSQLVVHAPAAELPATVEGTVTASDAVKVPVTAFGGRGQRDSRGTYSRCVVPV